MFFSAHTLGALSHAPVTCQRGVHGVFYQLCVSQNVLLLSSEVRERRREGGKAGKDRSAGAWCVFVI